MRVLISSLTVVLVSIGLLAAPAFAADQDSGASSASAAQGKQQPASPETVARNTVNQILEAMDGRRNELRQHPKELYDLINKLLIPHIDVPYMAQLVLGRPWRNATPEQRQRFIRAFKVMVIRTYGNALLGFDKQKIEYQPLRYPKDADDVTFHALVTTDSGDKVPVSLQMHIVDGQWKVYDGTVGSLSFVTNYRGQFRQIVRNQGVQALIDRLEKRYDLAGKPLSKDDSGETGDSAK